MRKILFLIACLSIFLTLQIDLTSQTNYTKGAVEMYSGDTLVGFIDFRNWKRNPKIIQFKTDLDQPAKGYDPLQVKSFWTDEGYYIGKIVKVDRSPHKLEKLSYSSEPKFVQDTLFLKVFLIGKASLLYAMDENLKPHYFIHKEGVEEELIDIKFLKIINGRKTVQKFEKFKGQLTFYFNDCPNLKNDIERSNLKLGSLMKLFKAYNECTKSKITFESKQKNVKLKWKGVIGLGFHSLDFTGNAPFEESFDSKIGIFFGLGMDWLLSQNQERWILSAWLIYKDLTLRSMSDGCDGENFSVCVTRKLGAKQLKLLALVKYQHPSRKLRPTFSFGLSNGFALKTVNEIERAFFSSSGPPTITSGRLFDDIQKYEQGILFGLGANYKRFSFDVLYERSNGFIQNNNFSTAANNFHFVGGYTF